MTHKAFQNLLLTLTLTFSITILISHPSYADAVEPLIEASDDLPPTFIDKALTSIGVDSGFDRSKGLDVSYIPSVFYNPETQFGGGALAIGLYKVDSATDDEQPSSVVINSYIPVTIQDAGFRVLERFQFKAL